MTAVNEAQEDVADRGPHTPRLSVLNGPDAGLIVRLDRPSLIVGSGPMAEFRLTDATVESEHVLLALEPDGIRLRDLSRNGGTLVATMRVRDAVFTQSITVNIGSTTLLIEIDAAGPASRISGRQPCFSELVELPYREARARALAEFEKTYVTTMLAQSKNVVAHAARRAGVERESFHRIMQRVRASARQSSSP